MSVAPGYPVRQWTDDELDRHFEVSGPHSQITCQGCIQLERRAFEADAVERGFVIRRLAVGWL